MIIQIGLQVKSANKIVRALEKNQIQQMKFKCKRNKTKKSEIVYQPKTAETKRKPIF